MAIAMQRLAYAGLLGMGLMLAVPQAQANRGVAFVHGTGKQTDALNNYWEPAIVNTARAGLPNSANYVVINCDFEKYMWTSEAAGDGFLNMTLQRLPVGDHTVNQRQRDQHE